MQWEYRFADLNGTTEYTRARLQDLGNDGWELVSVVDGFFTFKRPKPTPEVTQQVTQQDTQQVEYITPTAEHVGQMVEVRDDKNDQWEQRELYAVLPDRAADRFVCAYWDDPSEYCGWTYARVAVKR